VIDRWERAMTNSEAARGRAARIVATTREYASPPSSAPDGDNPDTIVGAILLMDAGDGTARPGAP
jgi:hypothetical protein